MVLAEAAHGGRHAGGGRPHCWDGSAGPEIAAAAAQAGRPARLQLKADTGVSRGGATAAEWPALVDAAGRPGRTASSGSRPAVRLRRRRSPGIRRSRRSSRGSVRPPITRSRPRTSEVRQIANIVGALTFPLSRLHLVRLAAHLRPVDPAGGAPGWWARHDAYRAAGPGETGTAGDRVSDGHRYVTTRKSCWAWCVGDADGVRAARPPARGPGARPPWPIAGTGPRGPTKFVVDFGHEPPSAGEEASCLSARVTTGELMAQEAGEAGSTISYEVRHRDRARGCPVPTPWPQPASGPEGGR